MGGLPMSLPSGNTENTVLRQNAAALWDRWLVMWNENPEIAHEIIGPGYRVHLPTVGATIDPAQIRDAATMADWVRAFTGKFADLRYRTDFGPVSDGNLAVFRWSGTAICLGRTGWPMDMAGEPITFVGVDILRIADGRIVECWTQGSVTGRAGHSPA
jgi:hypothetical protein